MASAVKLNKKETVDEALKNIIGLEKVKEKVKEFEKYMMYKIKAEAHGIKLEDLLAALNK